MARRKRMLNADYYKVDAKYMISSAAQDKKHAYKVINIQSNREYGHK